MKKTFKELKIEDSSYKELLEHGYDTGWSCNVAVSKYINEKGEIICFSVEVDGTTTDVYYKGSGKYGFGRTYRNQPLDHTVLGYDDKYLYVRVDNLHNTVWKLEFKDEKTPKSKLQSNFDYTCVKQVARLKKKLDILKDKLKCWRELLDQDGINSKKIVREEITKVLEEEND